MPFYKKISLSNYTSIYLWKISEEEMDLNKDVVLSDISLNRLAKMKALSQRKGFLAVRNLLKTIQYNDSDLFYDEFGKPYLKDNKKISISHSNEFACIIISDKNVGIDIELKSEKILKNVSFLFNEDFILRFEGNNEEVIALTTFCWGIKEAIFKLIPENDISIKENITIQPFQLGDNFCYVKVQINDIETSYTVQLDTIENYTLVSVIH